MSQPRQFVYLDQRFGWPGFGSSVIEPEVRVGCTPDKPHGYRYARLLCDCGTKYLVQISHLLGPEGRGQICSACARRRQMAKRPRLYRGRTSRHRSGYSVTIYMGWFKSKAEADAFAARCRGIILPERPPLR